MDIKTLIISACCLLASCSVTDTVYYIDATSGCDDNSGLSPEKAWKTLERASQQQLQAGEKLLLKRGETFDGILEITAQGTADKRITIDAYGDGNKQPCISAPDSSMYAMRIFNSDYLTVQNLDITNTGSIRLAGRTGLKIECRDYGTSHSIHINNIFVHDVNGSLVKTEGGGSGILIENGGKEILSNFDSLTIENCKIARCARNAMIWDGYSSRENWFPSKHTIVRNNLIEEVPGDGIVPIGCDSSLIEYNVMRDCPDVLPMTEAAAGFWPWSCDNTIIQFNDVSGHKAPWDAQAYDCDYNCTNTTIQYNYSHGNYGGLVLICNSGASGIYRLNDSSKVRYNISIGDGIRPKETRSGMFSPNIHIAGPVTRTLVERNIIHSNIKGEKEIDRTMITSDSWDGFADSTTFHNNIFYTAEKSRFNMTESTNNIFEENWFIGDYNNLPDDPKAKRVSDVYQQKVLDIAPDGYEALYRLMEEKEICGAKAHFVDKEKIEQFFNEMDK